MQNKNIIKLNDLIARFKQGQYSVREFQERLEPQLYSLLENTAVATEKIFKEFVNRLELIICTIPESEQREHAEILADEISLLIDRQ